MIKKFISMVICIFLIAIGSTALAGPYKLDITDAEWIEENKELVGRSIDMEFTIDFGGKKVGVSRVRMKTTFTFHMTAIFHQTGYTIVDDQIKTIYKWVDIDENGKGRATKHIYKAFESTDLFKYTKGRMGAESVPYSYEDNKGELHHVK